MRHRTAAGSAAIVGGVMGVALAPIMVIVKYLTGWAVIPEPSWIAFAKPPLGGLLTFTTPVGLWVTYGGLYTGALLLMQLGLIELVIRVKERSGRVKPIGLWIVMTGLCLVIVGDAVHTATWHRNGLTIPTPGTNPIANAAYAVHMMGMNVVMVGSLMTGVAALRRSLLAPWLAWLFIAIFPCAIALSVTLLPTTPAGGLWLFSLMMIAVGCGLRFARPAVLGGLPSTG